MSNLIQQIFIEYMQVKAFHVATQKCLGFFAGYNKNRLEVMKKKINILFTVVKKV